MPLVNQVVDQIFKDGKIINSNFHFIKLARMTS